MVIVKLSSGLSGAGDAVGLGVGSVGGILSLGAGDVPPPHAPAARTSSSGPTLPVAQAGSPRVSDEQPITLEGRRHGPVRRRGPTSAFHAGKKLSIAIVTACAFVEMPAQAQTPESRWSWHADASVFTDYNYQRRRVIDVQAWESHNWFMLSGDRPLGPGRISVLGALSIEPVTLDPIGSPQIFQTGASYH